MLLRENVLITLRRIPCASRMCPERRAAWDIVVGVLETRGGSAPANALLRALPVNVRARSGRLHTALEFLEQAVIYRWLESS